MIVNVIVDVILGCFVVAVPVLAVLLNRSGTKRFKLQRDVLKARETCRAALSQRDQAQEALKAVMAEKEHTSSATRAYLEAVNTLPSFGKHAGNGDDLPYMRSTDRSGDISVYPAAPVPRAG